MEDFLREQKEEYKQGDTVSYYLKDVKKKNINKVIRLVTI